MSTYALIKSRQSSTRSKIEADIRKAVNVPQIVTSQSMQGLGSFLGGGREIQSSEGYRQFKSWVYAAVNLIAKRVASQPILAAELVDAAPNAPRSYRPGSIKIPGFLRTKAATEQNLKPLPAHPAIDGLCRPNDIQRKFEFIYMAIVNLLVTGECYWVGGINEDGRFEAYAVPTTWIETKHENGLFTSFKLRTPGMLEGEPLEPDQVARTFLCDPADIRKAKSPLQAILPAVKVDESIQASQQAMMERGINPNLLITVGRSVGPDGKLSDRRPKLTGRQRQQVIRAVRDVWNRSVNMGDPGIIDGLIESVHKLQMTPHEMDWPQSGEIVKKRIMQAYAVNEIVLGEVQGGNRAQAVEAEKHLCEQAVNPVANALSETLTDWVGPMWETPERLVVFIEECEPKDPDLNDRRWATARRNGDVSADEFRAHQLGLPPREGKVDRNKLLDTVGGITGAVQVLQNASLGFISEEQVSALLQLFFELEEDVANRIAQGTQHARPVTDEPMPNAATIEQLSAAMKAVLDKFKDRMEARTDYRLERMAQGVETALKEFGREHKKIVNASVDDQIRNHIRDSRRQISGQMKPSDVT